MEEFGWHIRRKEKQRMSYIFRTMTCGNYANCVKLLTGAMCIYRITKVDHFITIIALFYLPSFVTIV